MEIHPYVRGRLRALPRQDETAGILLGTSENGVTRVTGFKRVTQHALRQAAFDAGPALAGFYRLQTPNAPTLLPEEEELWREFQPEGRCLFLLVKAAGGGAEATAWTRDNSSSPPVVENISLDSSITEIKKDDSPPQIPVRRALPPVPRGVLLYATFALLAAIMGVVLLQPVKVAPALSLALQSGPGELTAVWEQQGTPEERLEFAQLSILDGAKEQRMNLTPNYTSRGRITVRPRSRDVVFTLRVKYEGVPLTSRSATYVGFTPSPAPAAVARPASANTELTALRKRNRELEDDVAALRKQLTASKTSPDKKARFLGWFRR